MKNPLFINKKEWNAFTDIEMRQYVDDVFSYYRKNGFPYFTTSKQIRDEEFNKLMEYPIRPIGDDAVIHQSMHGLSLAWSYMPHSWDVKCNNMMSPKEAFNDDIIFRKVIEKRLKMGDNMSDNGIRKMIKMFSGVQSVSNFRPTAAAAIYQKYCKKNDVVLDMSSGYGGRLLGAIKAGVDYIGYEPCEKTFKGLMELSNYRIKNKITLIQSGSEHMNLEANTIDFAFTSPPYFDCEKYSDEPTQSYIKYPTKEDWLDGFIFETFQKVYKALKSKKYMLINVANVKSYKNLVDDIVEMAENCGFMFSGNLFLSLSNPTFTKNKHAYKYEPVLVFEKP